MTPEQEIAAVRRGRTAFKVPDRRWPVVTQTMLARASELGAPGPDDNPLVHSLLVGYVWLANVETNLKRAKNLAVKDGNQDLVKRLEAQLVRVEQLKEEWPLEIVG